LLNRVPASPLENAGLRLTGQLNLRRDHVDSSGARINHGERHKQARTILQNLTDTHSDAVTREIPKSLLSLSAHQVIQYQ